MVNVPGPVDRATELKVLPARVAAKPVANLYDPRLVDSHETEEPVLV